MRDRQVLLVLLGLVVAFPIMLGIASGSGIGPVAGVEGVLALGLLHATRERRRLIDAATPRTRPLSAARPRVPARRRATVQA